MVTPTGSDASPGPGPGQDDAPAGTGSEAASPPAARSHPYVEPARYEAHLEAEHGLAVRQLPVGVVAIPEHEVWALQAKGEWHTRRGKVLPAGTVLRQVRGRRAVALVELYRFIHPDETTREPTPRRGSRPGGSRPGGSRPSGGRPGGRPGGQGGRPNGGPGGRR